MPNIGPMEIVIVLIIALVVFGPKRLPELGKSLGKGHPRVQRLGQRRDRPDDDEPRRRSSRPPVVVDPGRRVRRRRRRHRRTRLRRQTMRRVKAVSHEDELSLVEHLDELRARIVVCSSSSASPWRSASGRTTCCSKSPTGRCPATTRS